MQYQAEENGKVRVKKKYSFCLDVVIVSAKGLKTNEEPNIFTGMESQARNTSIYIILGLCSMNKSHNNRLYSTDKKMWKASNVKYVECHNTFS